MPNGGIASASNIAIASCPELELIANDGTFLGTASSSTAAADGVCNEYSSYGSQYGADSIFNMYGSYGSAYSSTSAYDQFATTPPMLSCKSTNQQLNPVSKASIAAGGSGLVIDPDLLCADLQANGY